MSGVVRKNALLSEACSCLPCFRAPWNCRSSSPSSQRGLRKEGGCRKIARKSVIYCTILYDNILYYSVA